MSSYDGMVSSNDDTNMLTKWYIHPFQDWSIQHPPQKDPSLHWCLGSATPGSNLGGFDAILDPGPCSPPTHPFLFQCYPNYAARQQPTRASRTKVVKQVCITITSTKQPYPAPLGGIASENGSEVVADASKLTMKVTMMGDNDDGRQHPPQTQQPISLNGGREWHCRW